MAAARLNDEHDFKSFKARINNFQLLTDSIRPKLI